ncbi:LytR C-terminal domain-containing protein [Aeromicrobium sp. UC242_57]|uniref:LytR C-terminal domain-containing protein n=1 Tax=Aeromicrobium sp. UC242_57 TaxID=3374624 RepID=UPI00378913E8
MFVVATFIGFRLLTAGTEPVEADTSCQASVVASGTALDSNAVVINVFNASARSGLANRVRIDLQANGFRGGEIGNSTSVTKPRRVAILTNDRKDPRVRLVAAQFRDKVQYAKPDLTVDEGITVIVGDKYSGLKKSPKTSLRTDRDISICTPATPPV